MSYVQKRSQALFVRKKGTPDESRTSLLRWKVQWIDPHQSPVSACNQAFTPIYASTLSLSVFALLTCPHHLAAFSRFLRSSTALSDSLVSPCSLASVDKARNPTPQLAYVQELHGIDPSKHKRQRAPLSSTCTCSSIAAEPRCFIAEKIQTPVSFTVGCAAPFFFFWAARPCLHNAGKPRRPPTSPHPRRAASALTPAHPPPSTLDSPTQACFLLPLEAPPPLFFRAPSFFAAHHEAS